MIAVALLCWWRSVGPVLGFVIVINALALVRPLQAFLSGSPSRDLPLPEKGGICTLTHAEEAWVLATDKPRQFEFVQRFGEPRWSQIQSAALVVSASTRKPREPDNRRLM